MRFLRELARGIGLLITIIYCGALLLGSLLNFEPVDFNGTPSTWVDYVLASIMAASALALAIVALRFFKKPSPKLYWVAVGLVFLPWLCVFLLYTTRDWQQLIVPLIYTVLYGVCYAGYIWVARAMPRNKI